jgi:hypothetical protein
VVIAPIDWRRHVVIDPTLVRPAEVDLLIFESSRRSRGARLITPDRFDDLVRVMVEADVALVAPGRCARRVTWSHPFLLQDGPAEASKKN